MSGRIYAYHAGGELKELTQAQYADEDKIQALIEKHPVLLAGDQINPDKPRRWILVSREIGVPAEQEGGSRWYLDHLFLDQDAIPTFVEVKRSTDTRARREVVAQMLDYAANAIQHWPRDSIRENYEKNVVEQRGTTLYELGIDPENEDAYWQAADANLRAGRIRLIFAADTILVPLQRIIEFLNGQMVNTEVLGLEIKQYCSSDGLATLVPHIVGQTANAIQVKQGESTEWDEDRFLTQSAEIGGEQNAELCRKLMWSFKMMQCNILWGKGKKHGSFMPTYIGEQSHRLCSIYNWSKRTHVSVSFRSMKPPLSTFEYQQKMKILFEKIIGSRISDSTLGQQLDFAVGLLSNDENYSAFMQVMESYIEDIKGVENKKTELVTNLSHKYD